MATLEELQAQLSEMKDKLQLLEARLDAEKDLRQKTMRDSLLCPSCGGQKIYYIKQLKTSLPNTHSSYVYTTAKGVFRPKLFGIVQALCCANCRHTELQMLDISGLEGKREIEVLVREETKEGPYP